MSDSVERAKKILDEIRRTEPNIYTFEQYQELMIALCALVPELVAELEWLRHDLNTEKQAVNLLRAELGIR